MAAKYYIDDFIRTYLSLRKAIVQYEKDKNASMKYDTPCHSLLEDLQLSQFLLFCLENLDCYDALEDKEKVISKANRVAKNCVSCATVTQAEMDAFSITDLGFELMFKANLQPEILAYDEQAFLIHYIAGFPYLIRI